jgi:flagellin
MARINTNISSVIAQANLAKNQQELSLRLERLSTGLRINRGKDDPAGLIISERLKSDIQGTDTAIKNSDRASSVIATTESGLNEINDLLNSIKSLIVESANTGANSSAEREANQLQIDSAIDSITRISNTASFGGLKLLNGSLDYTVSGVRTSAIAKAQVNNASFVGSANLQVSVDVIASAQTGSLFYSGNTTPAGVTLSALTIEVAGTRGVQIIQIPSGRPLSDIVTAVNNLTSLTGVRGELINNNAASGLAFKTSDYGSDSFVSVRRLNGSGDPASDSFQLYRFDDSAAFPGYPSGGFGFAGLVSGGTLVRASRDTGRNVSALVNGTLATGAGLNLSINSTALGLNLLLTENAATRPDATATSFFITGGGALFQLGPQVTALQQANLGIPSIAASNIGGIVSSGVVQYLSSLKSGNSNSIVSSVAKSDFSVSSDILEQAIDEISVLRGRLGAFERNVLNANQRSLQSAYENLTSSQSQIRDADFARETSQLTRAQILASSGTSVLGLANQQSQSVLQLLG